MKAAAGRGWWAGVLTCLCGLAWPAAPAAASEIAPPATAAAAQMRVLVQELPPYAYNRRGRPEGFIPDLMVALGQELGLNTPLPLEFAPLPRASEQLRRNPYVMFAPVGRVRANENEFKWIRALFHNRIQAYRRLADTPMPSKPEDLKAVRRIAVTAGGAHQAMVEEAGFKNVLLVRSQVDALRRMMAGEADYCLLSDLNLPSLLAAQKVSPEAIQATSFVLADSEVHLAFSPLLPPAELARWHAALERLRRSGRLEALVHAHFGPRVQVPK